MNYKKIITLGLICASTIYGTKSLPDATADEMLRRGNQSVIVPKIEDNGGDMSCKPDPHFQIAPDSTVVDNLLSQLEPMIPIERFIENEDENLMTNGRRSNARVDSIYKLLDQQKYAQAQELKKTLYKQLGEDEKTVLSWRLIGLTCEWLGDNQDKDIEEQNAFRTQIREFVPPENMVVYNSYTAIQYIDEDGQPQKLAFKRKPNISDDPFLLSLKEVNLILYYQCTLDPVIYKGVETWAQKRNWSLTNVTVSDIYSDAIQYYSDQSNDINSSTDEKRYMRAFLLVCRDKLYNVVPIRPQVVNEIMFRLRSLEAPNMFDIKDSTNQGANSGTISTIGEGISPKSLVEQQYSESEYSSNGGSTVVFGSSTGSSMNYREL